MRLVIALCGHCVRRSETCVHRDIMREATSKIKIDATISHNCPIYKTLIPVVSLYKQGSGDFNISRTREEIIAEGKKIGARVKVKLKELEVGETGGSYDEPPEPTFEWVDVGEVMGTVVFAPAGKNRFFGVRLDDPVDLVLPERGKSWHTAHERKIEERWLPANKLNFVTK